jgi:hypothetical protein
MTRAYNLVGQIAALSSATVVELTDLIAMPGLRTFAAAGVPNGETVIVSVNELDTNGDPTGNAAIWQATYATAGTLTRAAALTTVGTFTAGSSVQVFNIGSYANDGALIVPTVLGHGKVWKDLVAPMGSAGVPSASAPTKRAFGPSGLREEYDFSINDYAFPDPFHINHDIEPGNKAYPHVHWSTNGTDTNTVKWEMQIMRALGHGQAAFAAPTTVYVEQAASGTAWQHMVAEVSDGDALTLVEPDELVLIVLRRVTNGGTNNTDQVFGLQVDLHYESTLVGTQNKAPDFYA